MLAFGTCVGGFGLKWQSTSPIQASIPVLYALHLATTPLSLLKALLCVHVFTVEDGGSIQLHVAPSSTPRHEDFVPVVLHEPTLVLSRLKTLLWVHVLSVVPGAS